MVRFVVIPILVPEGDEELAGGAVVHGGGAVAVVVKAVPRPGHVLQEGGAELQQVVTPVEGVAPVHKVDQSCHLGSGGASRRDAEGQLPGPPRRSGQLGPWYRVLLPQATTHHEGHKVFKLI